MDVRNKIIVRNTVLNFFGLVVPLAVGFVTIPMVVRTLGNDRFGILALVWVVFGYFGLFDLGLGRTTALVVWGALSLRVMPALRTRPVLHGKLVRPLFSFSGWLGLSSILYAVTSSMDRLVIGRALERVLEAAKLLAGDPDILFVIVGEGLKKEALRKKAASLGLRNAAFLPFQPYRDLPDLLASADVLLVPLDKEKSQLSVPSKLYTFMAAGRPILGLAEPDSEVANLLREKECGLAVPPDEAAAVAEAVRTLERSPEKRRLLGGNAREHVVRQFAKDKILGSYDKLLRSMVS